MAVTCLHLRLTYRCVHECDHCAQWGGPWQSAAMTRAEVERVLDDAAALATVETIRFEGGEPFLYYPVLMEGIRTARRLGFRVEVSTSGAWASDPGTAAEWLVPLAEAGVDWIGIHDDRFRPAGASRGRAAIALQAAERVGIPASIQRCAIPSEGEPAKQEERRLLLRGRGARRLADRIGWEDSGPRDRCTLENLRSPERLHVDPYGFVLLCPGLAMGSLYWETLRSLLESYAPDWDPIIGPLLRGGPEALAEEYDLPFPERTAGACHSCYLIRSCLRERFPDCLGPPAAYGIRDLALT